MKMIPIVSQYGHNVILTTISWKNDVPHIKNMAAEEINSMSDPSLKEKIMAFREQVDPLGAKNYAYFAFVSAKDEREPILHFEPMKNAEEMSQNAGIADLSAKRLVKQLNH